MCSRVYVFMCLCFYVSIRIFSFSFLLFPCFLDAQDKIPATSIQYVIQGTVRDSASKEILPGVNILVNDSIGVVTDKDGIYNVVLEKSGKYKITFSFVGYKSQIKSIQITQPDTYQLNVELIESYVELNQVVITAGKYEQPLSEISVSMEVIKPKMINSINPSSLEEVLVQVPSVNIAKQQISIRGGSGWSYGAGSRTMILVDGLPMLSADARDIKWNVLPLENIDQIEVIKGASSALYGAAALDGIVHIRTIKPGDKPYFKINLFGGYYNSPRNDSFQYWNSPPFFGNLQLLHTRKIKQWDLVVSGYLFRDEGYRKEEDNYTAKFFMGLQRKSKKSPKLRYGFNLTALIDSGGNFLYWQDAQNPFIPDSLTISRFKNTRFALDPYIHYYTENNSRHSLLTRLFTTNNKNNTNQGSFAQVWYGEYQYQKFMVITDNTKLTWTHGMVVNYNKVKSDSLYGEYGERDGALYAQVEQKINKINISFGTRLETYQVDTFKCSPSCSKRALHPIFRSGVVIQVGKASYLRGSLGQGIRFPSIAEKYIETGSGSTGLKIFPNDSLEPETGWSAEIGFKQGFSFSHIRGYLDIAGFWTEYQNMIEFTFGNYAPSAGLGGLGFAAINVSNARIYGMDVSAVGEANFLKTTSRFLVGYNVITPLNRDYIAKPTDTLGTEQFLKYRYRHTAKANWDITYKFLTAGVQLRYNSFMINIDTVLHYFVPGLREYRNDNRHGDWVLDANINFKINNYVSFGFYAKNLLNREYMYFPGNMGAPRKYSFQLKVEF